jgi:CRP/FNR family transcriptional regulator, anaerobic regulatory protein
MGSKKLIESLQKHIDLSGKEEEIINEQLVFKKIKKKQFLLHEGQVANDAAFVLNGCLRSYSIDQNGFEHILQFAPEGWWITDMYSFISQQQTHLIIDALTDTEVYLLSRKNQLILFDEVPKLERYFRIVTENSLVSSRQRLIDNMSLSAAQRYADFCSIYPTLIHDIPQKLIAAYIGVTPEFLSKLRSRAAGAKKS